MTTFALYAEIIFPAHNGRREIKIRRISECKISCSIRNPYDSAEITIPRKTRDFDRMNPSEWFRIGDPVEIRLGCDFNIYTEFTGYINRLQLGIPIVIGCKNEMFHLARKHVNIHSKSGSLKDLLQKIAPNYKIVCDETKIVGTVQFHEMTPAQCLEELRDQGIMCFFVGKELHAMDLMSRPDGKTHRVLLENCASDELTLREVFSTQVILKMVKRIGRALVVKYGDENPAKIIKRVTSGIEKSEQELRAEAKLIYTKSKVPGLDGTLELFGVPRCALGDKIELRSSLYNDDKSKNGTFYIESIEKTFSNKGYRQKVTLGGRVI
jgi:hypothetical protein